MQNKINQSGRSMVEMLGVLAIIGVLSVGGIAGYTTAMNKHRANEILNAASVRAMVVSTQIQNGSTSPTLAEFTDNKVGSATFGTDVKNTAGTGAWVKGTDNRFSLTLSGVDTKVCDQMKNIAGENSIIKAWGDNCTFLTYNNDLGSGTGENKPEVLDKTTVACTTNSDCRSCETCQENICVSQCNELLGEYCKNGTCSSITRCENLGAEDYMCITMYCGTNGFCTEKPASGQDEKPCLSNKDCDATEYCKIYYDVLAGTCYPIGTVQTIDNEDSPFNGYIYSLTADSANAESAENWCKANNTHLMTLAEAGLSAYKNKSCGTDCQNDSAWENLSVFNSISSGMIWTREQSIVTQPHLFFDAASDGGFRPVCATP